jgi:hypothetical protein
VNAGYFFSVKSSASFDFWQPNSSLPIRELDGGVHAESYLRVFPTPLASRHPSLPQISASECPEAETTNIAIAGHLEDVRDEDEAAEEEEDWMSTTLTSWISSYRDGLKLVVSLHSTRYSGSNVESFDQVMLLTPANDDRFTLEE